MEEVHTNVKRSRPLDDRMRAIAEAGRAAGVAPAPLPEVDASRSLESAGVTKYGEHFGNWVQTLTNGLRDSLARTRPGHLLFMDNVKPEGVQEACRILQSAGVAPHLFFRPYYAPNGQGSPASVENYINTARERSENYLLQPLIKQAYDEGRFHLKLFNETNIGLEGFPRGREGFEPAIRAFMHAHARLKTLFPKARFGNPAPTPGNDDVWFTGDAPNDHYFFHGPEAAHENPSRAEIEAAARSCLWRPVFEVVDEIYWHTYAHTTETVSGDLQTWYSRRFEAFVPFLDIMAPGKPGWILECDMGYDSGAEARGDAAVWWMRNVVDPNPRVAGVCWWWNAGEGEADGTWRKHQYRQGGQVQPIIPAIAAYRDNPGPVVIGGNGAGSATPGGTTPGGTSPGGTTPGGSTPGGSVPGGGSPTDATLTDPPEWVGFTDFVRGKVSYTPPQVAPGERYVRARRVEFVDEQAAAGAHSIFFMEPHDPSAFSIVSWADGSARIPHEKPENEPAGNFPMFAEGYSVEADVGGLPSARLDGLGIYGNRHVVFRIWWEVATVPQVTSDPDPVEPDPVEPDPVEPDPVEPKPVEPDPVDPKPVEPDPVEPGGQGGGNGGLDETLVDIAFALIDESGTAIDPASPLLAALDRENRRRGGAGFYPTTDVLRFDFAGTRYQLMGARRIGGGSTLLIIAPEGAADQVTIVER